MGSLRKGSILTAPGMFVKKACNLARVVFGGMQPKVYHQEVPLLCTGPNEWKSAVRDILLLVGSHKAQPRSLQTAPPSALFLTFLRRFMLGPNFIKQGCWEDCKDTRDSTNESDAWP